MYFTAIFRPLLLRHAAMLMLMLRKLSLKVESKQPVKDGWVKNFMAMCLSSEIVLVQVKIYC